jgi:TetR/AcrR family transcriptional repressor of nem operon
LSGPGVYIGQVTNSDVSTDTATTPARSPGAAAGKAGKRERLVAAAREVLYTRGVEKSTLADIAAAADVPVGNVYYYFKTKDALVSAVVEDYRGAIGDLGARLSLEQDPASRLKALLAVLAAHRERLASYGCPVGSLNAELAKRDDDLRTEAGAILAGQVDWAQSQFQEMGRDDDRELAVALIAAWEGVVLLAAALRDPQLISTEISRLGRWIDALDAA